MEIASICRSVLATPSKEATTLVNFPLAETRVRVVILYSATVASVRSVSMLIILNNKPYVLTSTELRNNTLGFITPHVFVLTLFTLDKLLHPNSSNIRSTPHYYNRKDGSPKGNPHKGNSER